MDPFEKFSDSASITYTACYTKFKHPWNKPTTQYQTLPSANTPADSRSLQVTGSIQLRNDLLSDGSYGIQCLLPILIGLAKQEQVTIFLRPLPAIKTQGFQ